VECDACYEGHDEEVEWVGGPAGVQPRAYIGCPEFGRIRIKPERLKRWKFAFPSLAEIVRASVGGSALRELVHERVWRTGRVAPAYGTREVCLMLGFDWSDGTQVFNTAAAMATNPVTWLSVGSPGPALVSRSAPIPSPQMPSARIPSVSDIGAWSNGALRIEADLLGLTAATADLGALDDELPTTLAQQVARLRPADRDRLGRAWKIICGLQDSRPQRPWTHKELLIKLATDFPYLRVTSRRTLGKVLQMGEARLLGYK
jgi:hypothetical protein